MNPFLVRGGGGANARLGWITDDNLEPVSNTETDFIPEAGHPFVTGLSNPSAIFDWTTPATGGLDSLPVLAEMLPGASVAGTMDGEIYAFSLPAGTQMDDGGVVITKPRGFVAAWSYPSGANGGPSNYGAPNMTAAHNALLSNAISTLLIPEPSSGILLMLGASVFGVVRRRRNG